MRVDRSIINNLKRTKRIENIILKENNLKEKLKLLQFLASFYNNYVTGVYYSEFMETQLIEISKSIKFNNINKIREKKNAVLHVMTKPYNVGGHTRVVNNWINFDGNRKYSILINEPENSDIPIWLKESVKKSGGSIILNESDDIIEKAKFLMENAMEYEKIVLHVHNRDIIPLITFSNETWRKPIYLYNHSDHKFWLGVSIADMVLDLTSDGKNMSMKKRGTKNNYVLPIPIMNEENRLNRKNVEDERVTIKQMLGLPSNSKVILSMATEYKYNDIRGYNFGEFAQKVIKTNSNIYILIIGANKKASKWIKLNKLSGGRIRAEGIVNKELVSKYLKIADMYLDSFPLNSYTSLLEAINSNVPSISLKTPVFDLDALKNIKTNSVDDIIDKINEIINNKYTCCNVEIKESVAKNHYKENWCKILNEMFEINIYHSIGSNTMINSVTNITDYERFMYETSKHLERLPIKELINLSFTNKMKIIFICKKEFIMSSKMKITRYMEKIKRTLIEHLDNKK